MRQTPYKDYRGKDLYEGDIVAHPDGSRARVVYDESFKDEHRKWRAVYEDGLSLWLGLQVGSRGMLVKYEESE